jgi:hypothetical protein
VRGRRIETLCSGMRSAGRHAVEWRPRGLRSGVYLARLQSAGFVATRKLVLCD